MIMCGMLNNVNTPKLKYYNDYEYDYNRRIKFVLFLLLLLFRYPASTGLCPARLMLLMRNENYYISAVGWVLHHFFPAQSVQDIWLTEDGCTTTAIAPLCLAYGELSCFSVVGDQHKPHTSYPPSTVAFLKSSQWCFSRLYLRLIAVNM